MSLSEFDYLAMQARLNRGKNTTANEGCDDESKLNSQIFSECRRRGWIVFHGSMAERTHRTAGEPDFQILMHGGKLLMVECKTKTGKLSPAQLAMKVHAETLGHTIHVVRSFEEFLKLI